MCDSTQGSLCPSPMGIHQCMWIQWSILQTTTYIQTYIRTYFVQNEWSLSLFLNTVQARQKPRVHQCSCFTQCSLQDPMSWKLAQHIRKLYQKILWKCERQMFFLLITPIFSISCWFWGKNFPDFVKFWQFLAQAQKPYREHWFYHRPY